MLIAGVLAITGSFADLAMIEGKLKWWYMVNGSGVSSPKRWETRRFISTSVLLSGAGLTLAGCLWRLTLPRNPDYQRCQECGYLRTGLRGGRCPECGKPAGP